MIEGATAIRDPEMRRLRALMMLDYKLRNGATNADVAKEFKISERTVERTFTWMKKAELVTKAEDKALSELVPLAHAAIKQAMEGDDAKLAAEMALEVFKGLLPSFSKKTVAAPVSVGGPNLDDYISQLRGELEQRGLVEGEVVGLIATTPEGDSEEGPAAPSAEQPSGLDDAPGCGASVVE